MKPKLTPRQEQLVTTIDTFTRQHGYGPSLRECAAIMHVHFTRVATLAADAEIRGAVARTPGVARSLRVVRPGGRR